MSLANRHASLLIVQMNALHCFFFLLTVLGYELCRSLRPYQGQGFFKMLRAGLLAYVASAIVFCSRLADMMVIKDIVYAMSA